MIYDICNISTNSPAVNWTWPISWGPGSSTSTRSFSWPGHWGWRMTIFLEVLGSRTHIICKCVYYVIYVHIYIQHAYIHLYMHTYMVLDHLGICKHFGGHSFNTAWKDKPSVKWIAGFKLFFIYPCIYWYTLYLMPSVCCDIDGHARAGGWFSGSIGDSRITDHCQA